VSVREAFFFSLLKKATSFCSINKFFLRIKDQQEGRGALTFLFDKKGILCLLKIEFMWHFLKIGITAFKHEVFGFPMWVQETYQTFEDYRKERGKPLTRGL
jgi:hypothetical protein